MRLSQCPAAYVKHGKAMFKPITSIRTVRSLVTLAVESSCDDTAVAVAELIPTNRLVVHSHEKLTSANDSYGGIRKSCAWMRQASRLIVSVLDPLVALHSHRQNLAPLIQRALQACPRPDFISVTRGPGMRSNLSVGIDTCKGLALGLNVPLLGVHHMQAHALTPRLTSAMAIHEIQHEDKVLKPEFPFLTVLVSGGHTMLIETKSLTENTILAQTQDIALGDCLDKAARAILPAELLRSPYGKALEEFAFPRGADDYDYTAPISRQQELERRITKWQWSLSPPFAGKTTRRMAFSFSGLLTSIQQFLERKLDADGPLIDTARKEEISLAERRDMARELLRVAFEHLASRILLHMSNKDSQSVRTLVVSGGVASVSQDFGHYIPGTTILWMPL